MKQSLILTISVVLAAHLLSSGCDQPPPAAAGKTSPAPPQATSPEAPPLSSTADLQQFRADLVKLLPDFATWGATRNRRTELLDQDGRRIGYLLIAPANRTTRTKGYRDVISVAAILSPENRVIGVILGAHRETPRYLQKLRTASYFEQWNGLTPEEAARQQVDAVTGATLSCNAIAAELRDVFQPESPVTGMAAPPSPSPSE